MNKTTKNFLAAAILILFTATTFAQSQFGIKGGVNMSNIGYNPSGTTSPDGKTSFHAGVILDIPVRGNKMMVIAPEVLASIKGANYQLIETDGFNVKRNLSLMYLSVPVSIKYQKEDKTGPVFGLGPYVSFLAGVRDKQTFKYTTLDSLGSVLESADSTHIETGTDGYNSIDCGFHFTVGIKFKMGLFLTARYELGLVNIVKETTVYKNDPSSGLETSTTSQGYGRNTNLQFSIGWMFGGGKKSNYY